MSLNRTAILLSSALLALVVAPASSARPAQNRQVCDLSPRTGFNESGQIGAC